MILLKYLKCKPKRSFILSLNPEVNNKKGAKKTGILIEYLKNRLRLRNLGILFNCKFAFIPIKDPKTKYFENPTPIFLKLSKSSFSTRCGFYIKKNTIFYSFISYKVLTNS